MHTLYYLLLAIFNLVIGYFPSFHIRRLLLRGLGWKVGSKVLIGYGVKITSLTTPCSIGNNVFINSNILLDNRGKISICNNVSVASGVKIYTAGHNVTSSDFKSYTSPVTLSDYSVVMSNASIMPGVKVGEGSVILNSAVVTSSTKELSIVGGVPARYIKMRTSNPKYTPFIPLHLGLSL